MGAGVAHPSGFTNSERTSITIVTVGIHQFARGQNRLAIPLRCVHRSLSVASFLALVEISHPVEAMRWIELATLEEVRGSALDTRA